METGQISEYLHIKCRFWNGMEFVLVIMWNGLETGRILEWNEYLGQGQIIYSELSLER